jgi:vacuole morphology and inheritance protein 14
MLSTPQVSYTLHPSTFGWHSFLILPDITYFRSVPTTIPSRSKLGREDIKWQELLLHFRTVQAKHEKARRQAPGTDFSFSGLSPTSEKMPAASGQRPPMRRKVTGLGSEVPNVGSGLPGQRAGALSPLNPRARAPTGGASSSNGSLGLLSPTMQAPQKVKRNFSLTRK